MRTDQLNMSRHDRVHEVLKPYVERGDVPGVVAVIHHSGENTVTAIGKQSVDGQPMRHDTIFRIASMTKPVIAAATMTLVEEGALSLDESIDPLLPELADRQVLKCIDGPIDDTVPAFRPITVRDLLTFRSGYGIVMAPPGTYPIQRAMDALQLGQDRPNPQLTPEPDEWIRRMGTLPLIHQPGERWMYNTGSDVLGVLISRASGKPLETFLSERIFQPLRMTDTGFYVSPDRLDRVATSYGLDQRTGNLEIYDPAENGQWSMPPAFPSGAGGLVSTADDFLAFAQMLLNHGMHRRERVLSRSSVEIMTVNHLTDDQQASARPILESYHGWGFGLAVVTCPNQLGAAVGSYGWSGGLGTTWLNDPTQRSTLMLLTQVNWESPSYPEIVRDFLAAFCQHDQL